MKQSILCIISIILICLHLTNASINSISGHMTTSNDNNPRKVGSIHRRVIAIPSARGGPSKASENNSVPTIDRTIKTLRRFRRVRKSVTAYPKHHLLQPIEVPLDEVHPKEGLNSTTAPYTDNHHSWKKTQVITW